MCVFTMYQMSKFWALCKQTILNEDKKLKDILYDSYLYSLKTGTLSQFQKQGIFNLLPKKDKDLRYLLTGDL